MSSHAGKNPKVRLENHDLYALAAGQTAPPSARYFSPAPQKIRRAQTPGGQFFLY